MLITGNRLRRSPRSDSRSETGRPSTLVLTCAVLALVALLAPSTARPQETSGATPAPADDSESWTVLERRSADGEQCIVCRQRIHAGDIVEVRYKGRTFHVAAKMLEEFEADPERYFEVLEAHSALFDEAAMETPRMSTGWLVFGLWVLVGLVFGAACSYVALDRGRPALGWFFGGLLVNFAALVALLVKARRPGDAEERAPSGLRKIPRTASPSACPRCGGLNHPSASACSSCGRELTPTVEPETARA